MSVNDWAWLRRFDELLCKIYVVDSEGLDANVGRRHDELPWYVALAFGSFPHKHTSGSDKLLPTQEVSQGRHKLHRPFEVCVALS